MDHVPEDVVKEPNRKCPICGSMIAVELSRCPICTKSFADQKPPAEFELQIHKLVAVLWKLAKWIGIMCGVVFFLLLASFLYLYATCYFGGW